MTTIAEALEALHELSGMLAAGPSYRYGREVVQSIRAALESAAQQERDWEAIEEWLRSERDQERCIGLEVSGPVWEAFLSRVMPSDDGSGRIVRGDTRAEAIAVAAAWCRGQAGGG